MDATSEERLQFVCPVLADKIRQLAEVITDEPIRVTQGLRSWDEQEALYQQGRTTLGNIVTNAPPGHSWHEFGMAVDVAPFDTENRPDWNLSHSVWQKIITVGESLGMYSGNEFTHKDNPHFQMTGTFPVSPNDIARYILVADGMEAVWKAAGLVSA